MIDFKGSARRATAADFEAAAALARVSVACIRAVNDVEARNSGYDAKKRPIILFEPHKFWGNLLAAMRKDGELNGPGSKLDRAAKAGLAYQSWGEKPYPKSSDGNYARLAAAIEIDEEAAFRSVSIGLGQIMGENYKAAGHESARAMFEAAKESEGEQLRQMASFILTQRLSDNLRSKDWAGFARRYNGPGYAKNRYDERLARAYEKWSAILAKPRAQLTAADLHAAGSRTIAATGEAKAAVQAVTAAGATASAAMTQAGDVVSQAQDLAEGLRAGAGWLELAKGYWPLLLVVLATAVAAYFAWRVWIAMHAAETARLDQERNAMASTGRI